MDFLLIPLLLFIIIFFLGVLIHYLTISEFGEI